MAWKICNGSTYLPLKEAKSLYLIPLHSLILQVGRRAKTFRKVLKQFWEMPQVYIELPCEERSLPFCHHVLCKNAVHYITLHTLLVVVSIWWLVIEGFLSNYYFCFNLMDSENYMADLFSLFGLWKKGKNQIHSPPKASRGDPNNVCLY